ncbi:MAG: tetraacyldisaccharide 4'-kinase [Desulfobulbaceae bacterium]|uniref:Tetraacyldisaccharide 4'-kinase n=1 Tax=Candidatus Desulfobia pelagia TaxID=2841692 RepID=A0A8J6NDK4_9BACT|nr:tetraacyldisaccharide 4'-kinase [Candidatus Desulfobia pelagia]
MNNINLLFSLGRPFAPLYGWLMSFRAALYKKGVFACHRLSVPVVSVGNLTMGGTGKTPVTLYLAKLLFDRRPAIVSRGYKGKSRKEIHVVSDGKTVDSNAAFSGDEPVFLAESLPGVPVLTAKKRVAAGRYAVDNFQAGIILLDDGFQHLALVRDVNIALFKIDSFLGNNRIFPGGDMREPLKALCRADCFVLTCVDDENRERAMSIRKALEKRFPEIPVYLAAFEPAGLVSMDGSEHAVDGCEKQKFYGFCGLASPVSFERTLAGAGIDLAGFQAFKDHHDYTGDDLNRLIGDAKTAGAQSLITTEKDMVKLKNMSCDFPLTALRMAVVPEEEFDQFVLDRLS